MEIKETEKVTGHPMQLNVGETKVQHETLVLEINETKPLPRDGNCLQYLLAQPPMAFRGKNRENKGFSLDDFWQTQNYNRS